MNPADPDPAAVDGPEPRPVNALEDPYGASRLTRGQRAAWATLTAVSLSLDAQLEAGLHREAGLTPFEFHLLYMLGAGDAADAEDGGGMSMSEAARLVDASLSRLSHVVRRMEERDWLERRPSPEDARVTLVRLAPEGRRRLAASVPAYETIIERLLAGHLDDGELEELTRLCLALLDGLNEGHWVTSAARGEDGAAAPDDDDAPAGGGPAS